VFTNSTPPIPPGATTTNFLGETNSSSVAAYLDNATGVPGAPVVTSAIGYVSPDWTTVAPNADKVLPNGTKSTLVVAALKSGTQIYIPLVADLAGVPRPEALHRMHALLDLGLLEVVSGRA